MLTLEQYGVKLVRLGPDDLELVRGMRNRPDIAAFMEYRETISPKEQKDWFDKINNKYNYYFVIVYGGKKIGLINAKNYDATQGFGEGGIFIWDNDYIDSFVPVLATLCLLNFAFYAIKLCEKSRARVLRSNIRAIQYNKQIGYKLLPGQENVENQLYELTLADYEKSAARLMKAAAQLNKGNDKLKVTGTVSDKNLEVMNDLLLRNA